MNTRQLEEHIRALATLGETESPLISCYVQVGSPFPGFHGVLGERVQTLRRSLEPRVLPAFEDALTRIERFLEDRLEEWARGIAVFARGGTQPFFLALQFRVPVPTWMAVGPTPALYHLVELRDNYDHYAILLATSTSARILGVNLGAVTEQIWKARPELRTRVGHEWTKDHFQDHRQARTRQFVNDLIHSLERVMAEGAYGHLILAGNPRVIATIKKALPKHLHSNLIDTVPAAASDQLSDVVASTLQSFLEHEEMDSQAIAEKLVSQIHTQGLAVAGTLNTLRALQNGQADVLVIAKDYAPGEAWECRRCHKVEFTIPAPAVCPSCQLGLPREFDIREEIVRLAGRENCGIEVVEHSDPLMNLGGVGCLLHFLAPDTYLHAAA